MQRLLPALSTSLMLILLSTSTSCQSPPTNIVLIMIDDLGWMDLHCQGNERLSTPCLDKLAAQGVRFTDAYAASPVCSPVRAALLTGLAPARLQITNHIPDQKRFIPDNPKILPAAMLDHLPLDRTTLAERLQKQGYATAFMGKWHLCGRGRRVDDGRGDPRFLPRTQGFDVNVGGCAWGGPPTFFDPYGIYRLPSRRKGEYLPDRLADEAGSFIRKNRDRPFLLCLWPYTVHWPMEAPDSLLKKYRGREGPGLKDHRYGAMIEAMDAAMGRVIATLDETGIADRTLVIFTSDNGGYSGVADNRPLREGKGFLYEGGIRVPLIIRWPGVAKPGTVCRTPVITMDLHATALDATKHVPAPGDRLDGESLRPLLDGRGQLKRDAVFFHYPNYAFHRRNRLGAAVRAGDYKLIRRFDDNSLELYDVRRDIGESRNLAHTESQRAASLNDRLDAWLKETGAAMPLPVTEPGK